MSCHLQPNVAKATGHQEKRLKKLIFTFEITQPSSKATPKPVAYILLTEKQFKNFFDMKNIAAEKNLTAVEMFVQGVQWQGNTPSIETSDFIIHRNLGVALKAYVHGNAVQTVQSNWLDWPSMILLQTHGDSLVPAVGSDDTHNAMPCESIDHAMKGCYVI